MDIPAFWQIGYEMISESEEDPRGLEQARNLTKYKETTTTICAGPMSI